MYWQGKKVLVLGYGITGKSMISYLRRHKAEVYIYDDNLGFSKPSSDTWEEPEKVFDLKDIDVLAVSPGFAPTHKVVSHFASMGVEVLGDIEIAYRDRQKDDWVAVTGTNGKTTTTMLIDYILRQIGVSSQTFGNIGVPVLDAVSFDGIPVVEVSSFQLEYTSLFHPHVGVFLNLTPDHLNRHGDMEGYYQAKLKMFKAQASHDIAVLNLDDQWTKRAVAEVPSKVLTFSKFNSEADVYYSEGNIFYKDMLLWDISKSYRFLYPPYLEDLLGAIAAVVGMGYKEQLREMGADILSGFVFARHRMEEVVNVGGVVFINDSKATNVASTIAALRGFDGSKLLLILGGSKKNTSYDELAEEIRGREVKYVALIGETAPDIENSFKKVGYNRYIYANSLEDAVRLLWEKAVPGDVILLSPACASFDMFNNYKHRGDTFVEIANRLAKEYVK